MKNLQLPHIDYLLQRLTIDGDILLWLDNEYVSPKVRGKSIKGKSIKLNGITYNTNRMKYAIKHQTIDLPDVIIDGEPHTYYDRNKDSATRRKDTKHLHIKTITKGGYVVVIDNNYHGYRKTLEEAIELRDRILH